MRVKLMSDQNFWLCIDTLAVLLDGSRAESESTLDRLEADIKRLPTMDRAEIRRKLIVIVAQAARLEMRLADLDGPLLGHA